jgi:APA family basic amino acid/polyamine antiporter
MVGAGVFVLSGVAINDAGPGALISFGLAGLAILCSAFSFMVVASLARAGELGYAPVGQALRHNFWGFITAWAFYISSIACTAFVLHAFGVYLHDFFISAIPASVLAILAAIIMTLINLSSTSYISRIEGVLVLIKIGILLLLVGFGLTHLGPQDFQPLLPHGTSSILATSGLLFIAYLGFSVITNIAGDVKDPKRTVPRAIFLSIIIVILIYVGVVLALLSTPLSSYDEASIGHVAAVLMGPLGSILMPLAALVSTLSAANSNILGSSEIMVKLASHRDVPTAAGRLWHGHPFVSVLFGAIVYLSLLVSGQAETTIALANVAAIAAIILVNVAAIRIILQRRAGSMRLFGGPTLPLLGLVGCVSQLFLLGFVPVVIGLTCVAAGGFIYLGRKRFHHQAHHQQLLKSLKTSGSPIQRILRKR